MKAKLLKGLAGAGALAAVSRPKKAEAGYFEPMPLEEVSFQSTFGFEPNAFSDLQTRSVMVPRAGTTRINYDRANTDLSQNVGYTTTGSPEKVKYHKFGYDTSQGTLEGGRGIVGQNRRGMFPVTGVPAIDMMLDKRTISVVDPKFVIENKKFADLVAHHEIAGHALANEVGYHPTAPALSPQVSKYVKPYGAYAGHPVETLARQAEAAFGIEDPHEISKRWNTPDPEVAYKNLQRANVPGFTQKRIADLIEQPLLGQRHNLAFSKPMMQSAFDAIKSKAQPILNKIPSSITKTIAPYTKWVGTGLNVASGIPAALGQTVWEVMKDRRARQETQEGIAASRRPVYTQGEFTPPTDPNVMEIRKLPSWKY